MGEAMIHAFQQDDENIVLDIASGAVHSLDALAYAICGFIDPKMDAKCPDEVISALSGDFSREEVEEAYGELYSLYADGLLFSEDEPYPEALIKGERAPIKALCLHVSHDCNLRCEYCFAQTGDFGTKRSLMAPEVAEKAIDFVIESSKNRRNIEVDFFGGEPLMAWDTVVHTVEYANKKGAESGKVFRFTVTTNGVLLDDEKIKYINEHMSNAVLSVDGRKSVNDNMRKTVSGAGSFDIIMPRFKKLVEARPLDRDYYMRGTYTSKNLDFAEDVLELYRAGYDQVSVEPVSAPQGCGFELKAGHLPRIKEEYRKLAREMLEIEGKGGSLNFFHFNVDLEQGPCVIKRLRGCGAGCEYVAVTPEGDIYPCHQFVGEKDFYMGNIMDDTFDKGKAGAFSGVSVYSRPQCRECWARYYCSGGCSAANYFSNKDINISYEIGCELEKMRLECALFLAVKRGGE